MLLPRLIFKTSSGIFCYLWRNKDFWLFRGEAPPDSVREGWVHTWPCRRTHALSWSSLTPGTRRVQWWGRSYCQWLAPRTETGEQLQLGERERNKWWVEVIRAIWTHSTYKHRLWIIILELTCLCASSNCLYLSCIQVIWVKNNRIILIKLCHPPSEMLHPAGACSISAVTVQRDTVCGWEHESWQGSSNRSWQCFSEVWDACTVSSRAHWLTAMFTRTKPSYVQLSYTKLTLSLF